MYYTNLLSTWLRRRGQGRADEIRKRGGLAPGEPVRPPPQEEICIGVLEPGGKAKTYNIRFFWDTEKVARREGKRTSDQTKEMAASAGMDPVIVEEDTWWQFYSDFTRGL